MKFLQSISHVFIVQIITLLLGFNAKSDTIDYWSIKLNTKVIVNFNEYDTKPDVFINLQVLHNSDNISVSYYTDRPWPDAYTTLVVKDDQKHNLTVAGVKGICNPVSFRAAVLLDKYMKSGCKEFYLYLKPYSADNRTMLVGIIHLKN